MHFSSSIFEAAKYNWGALGTWHHHYYVDTRGLNKSKELMKHCTNKTGMVKFKEIFPIPLSCRQSWRITLEMGAVSESNVICGTCLRILTTLKLLKYGFRIPCQWWWGWKRIMMIEGSGGCILPLRHRLHPLLDILHTASGLTYDDIDTYDVKNMMMSIARMKL